MKSRMCVLGLLGVCLLASAGLSEDDDDRKQAEAARQAILDLVSGKGDAKEIHARHSAEHIGRVFKLKSKGGVGIEGMQEERGNGIETKILTLARRELEQDSLKRESASLVRMAETVKAIGAVYAHEKVNPRCRITQKEWDNANKLMIEGSESLIQAVKARDPRTVRTAVGKINQSCNECHRRYCHDD